MHARIAHKIQIRPQHQMLPIIVYVRKAFTGHHKAKPLILSQTLAASSVLAMPKLWGLAVFIFRSAFVT